MIVRGCEYSVGGLLNNPGRLRTHLLPPTAAGANIVQESSQSRSRINIPVPGNINPSLVIVPHPSLTINCYRSNGRLMQQPPPSAAAAAASIDLPVSDTTEVHLRRSPHSFTEGPYQALLLIPSALLEPSNRSRRPSGDCSRMFQKSSGTFQSPASGQAPVPA